MQDEENPFFFNRPIGFLKKWVELIVPALSALLARAVLHLESHLLPLVRSNLGNHTEKLLVLLVVPSSLLRLLLVHIDVDTFLLFCK